MTNNFKPALFDTDMVQANFENRKTQTRRSSGLESVNKNPNQWIMDHRVGEQFIFKSRVNENEQWFLRPRFVEGDILWVRETWNHWPVPASPFVYKATDLTTCGHTWKPSIHMPKEAARMFLKVKKVRVERLQDISESDAIAEGIKVIDENEAFFDYEFKGKNGHYASARGSFFSLWKKIYGIDSLKSNPFVWVYEYEMIEKPENFGGVK